MGLKYTFYDESHKKIGIVTKWTTEEEEEHLKILYDLDEIRVEE